MKAVVVESKKEYSVVLKEDGTFERIRAIRQVGEELDLNEIQKTKTIRFRKYIGIASGIAAAAVITLGVLGYRTVKVQAYSYVTVDAASSVEYTLNRMDQVIGVRALDEASESFVKELSQAEVINRPIEEVLEMADAMMKAENGLQDAEWNGSCKISIAGGNSKADERIDGRLKNLIETGNNNSDQNIKIHEETSEVNSNDGSQNIQKEYTDTASGTEINEHSETESFEAKNNQKGTELTEGKQPEEIQTQEREIADTELLPGKEGEYAEPAGEVEITEDIENQQTISEAGGEQNAPEMEISEGRGEGAPQSEDVQQPVGTSDPEYDRSAPQDIPDGYAP